MSGHSKWHRIKHKKAVVDAKKGQEFTRLASQISTAARVGSDPSKNPSLREAIDRAKRANMPQVNIDRLLDKAQGNVEKIVYECFGPEGVAIIVIAKTDNSKRAVAEVRSVLKGYKASLGQSGSVMWKFDISDNGSYKAKYGVSLSDKARDHATKLVAELEACPDVVAVFSELA